MTSHQLAIAKASFSAGLLRSDPTLVSREEIFQFHTLLKSVTLHCSSENVQQCKKWILKNIFQSAARSIALGKYLTALMASLGGSEGSKDNKTEREPSIKRQRLHILYLVNDILYHAKYRISDATICTRIQPVLEGLIGSCASFKDCPKHEKKVLDLIQLWREKDYYSNEFIDKLRETVINAQEAGRPEDAAVEPETKEEGSTRPRSIPYNMPASHGDPLTPWYDLPAGNLMPLIVPNSTRPINPDMIKPLRFMAGPANDVLVEAVKRLLDDVKTIFEGEPDQNDKTLWDIDELGQPIVLDEITNEVIDGEGYYGWSRNFCEKMKRRKYGRDVPSKGDEPSRLGQNISSSPETRKRRYSDSDESRDRSQRRRRSYSSTCSSLNIGRNGSPHPRSKSRSRSRSRSPRRAETSQDLHQSLPPPHDGPPAQLLVPNIPSHFQQGMNPNFPPPPIYNMNFSGQAPQLGPWAPLPLPFQFNHNPPQLGAWPQVLLSQQPGNPVPNPQQSQTGQLPPSGPSVWHGNQSGHKNGHGGNKTLRGGSRGRGWW